jgi:hypothetical protein
MIGASIDNAFATDGVILFTTYIDGSVHLQILELGSPVANMDLDEILHVRTLSTLPSSITSLLVGEIDQRQYAIVAEWSETTTSLSIQPISGGERHEIDLLGLSHGHARLDAVGSLVLLNCLSETFLLLCGTRNGLLITCEISTKTFEVVKHRVDRLGATSVLLTMDNKPEHEHNFFISCDAKLYYLRPNFSRKSDNSTRRWYDQPHNIRQVWLSDVAQPYLSQPSINTFTQLHQTTNQTTKFDDSLLLINNSQIFVADLNVVPTVIPRKIKIEGTPSRLLFSPALDALVVAVSINGKSALQFVDPETGEDISQPIDQASRLPVDFVSGLGNHKEKIWGLSEWKFTKDATTWNFIIAATSMGRVLMISIDYSHPQGNGTSHDKPRKIRYYTRYRFRSQHQESVYSVTGFPQGLLWCAGNKLFCDILDQVNKKFVRAAEYDLPSPALSLEYSDGVIYALTQAHSLETLQLTLNEDGDSHIVRTHGDQLTRNALHHIMLQPSPGTTLHLVSDKSCSLVGLLPITNTKADTLETVFDAELPHSIIKLRSTKCRPIWDETWNNSKTVATQGFGSLAMNQPEVIGLSIMGSLSHFTVLDFKAWSYLRFIVDLAIRSRDVCKFTHKDDPLPADSVTEPKLRMQIDGDILKRCLEGRHLEKLLLIGHNTPKSKEVFQRFCGLLQGYHEGRFEEDSELEVYIDQGYLDLAYFLRPVL